MAWNNVSKPSVLGWNAVNPPGKEQYDDILVTYDSATTYYDGINSNQWTDVAKPTTNTWVDVAKPT